MGIYAVLEVTGEPREVFARYVEQLTATGLSGLPSSEEVVDGSTVTRRRLDEAGGDGFTLELIERPGRPTQLIISAGHD